MLCLRVIGLPAPGASLAQATIPADFAIPQGEASPGVVTFSHRNHSEAGFVQCGACHPKLFETRIAGPGSLTMGQMHQDRQCGACHRANRATEGKAAFATEDPGACARCHAKQ